MTGNTRCQFIDVIDTTLRQPGPIDETHSAIYREWNETLRDEVVLPLLPGVLHDAYQAQMLSAEQLADMLTALNNSPFGREHVKAIAGRNCLMRVRSAGSHSADHRDPSIDMSLLAGHFH